LRVVIYLDDHELAHVHVFGDGSAKIGLVAGEKPEFVWADTMSRGEIRGAMRLVEANQPFLLRKWEDIHGGAE